MLRGVGGPRGGRHMVSGGVGQGGGEADPVGMVVWGRGRWCRVGGDVWWVGGVLGGRAAGEEVVGVVLGVRVVARIHHLTNLKISNQYYIHIYLFPIFHSQRFTGIWKDKTMFNKFLFNPNGYTQNYPSWLQFVVESLGHST